MKKLFLLFACAALAISCNDQLISAIEGELETQSNAVALKNEDNLKLVLGTSLKVVQDAIDVATKDPSGNAPGLVQQQDSQTIALTGSTSLASGGTITINDAVSSIQITDNGDTKSLAVSAEINLAGVVVTGLSGDLSGTLVMTASADMNKDGQPTDVVVFSVVGSISTTLSDGTIVDFPVEAKLTLNTDGTIGYDVTIDGETTSFSVDAESGNDAGSSSSVTPPETTISAGPIGIVTTFSNEFKFGCDVSNCTFECKLGSAVFAPCTSPKTYTGQDDGSYTFEVRAAADGEVDASPAKRGYTVDTAAAPGSAPTFSNITADGFTIHWQAAVDPHTAQGNLEYAVYVSTSNELDLSNVAANAIEVTTWTQAITSIVAFGLSAEVTYTTYVLVSNDRGIISLYPRGATTTSQAAIYLFNAGQSDGSIPAGTCSANIPVGLTCNNVAHVQGNIALMSVPPGAPVRGTNQTLIANNWADLFDSSIENSLQDAGVLPASQFWWSGADANGFQTSTGAGIATRTCYTWTTHATDNGVQTFRGTIGSGSSTTGTWLGHGYTTFCNASYYVLCACSKGR